MILDEFLQTFPGTGDQFLQGIRDTVRANLTWREKEILTLASIYSIDVIEEALSVCVMFRPSIKTRFLGYWPKYHKKAPLPQFLYPYLLPITSEYLSRP